MAQELTIKIGGLADEQNPNLTDIGQASVCENIWFRRLGEAEPRPSFGVTNLAASMTNRCFSLYVFEDAVYGHTNTTAQGTAASKFRNFTDNAEVLLSTDAGGSTSLQMWPAFNKPETFQGNLYVPTQQGVVRVASGSSGVYAGLPVPDIGEATSDYGAVGEADNAYEQDKDYAYRITYVETIGDQVLESAPSARFFASITTADAKYGSIAIAVPQYVFNRSAKIRIYRSLGVAAGSVPTDELFLAHEYAIAVTAKAVLYADSQPDATLGQSLYTNGGNIAKANYPPPMCRVLKEFNSMMFYGNINESPTIRVQGFLPNVNSGVSTGDPVNWTSGSATAAAAAYAYGSFYPAGIYVSTTGNYPGAAATHVAAFTKLVSGTATTITTDTNALATGTRTASFWQDLTITAGSGQGQKTYWLTAGGQYKDTGDITDSVVANASRIHNNLTYWRGHATGVVSKDDIASYSLAHIYSANKFAPVNLTPVTPDIPVYDSDIGDWQEDFVIPSGQSISAYYRFAVDITPSRRGLSVPSVTASNILVSISAGSSDAVVTQHGARLYFSEVNQPEAVPLLNFVDIGNKDDQILGLARTRDSLFVFKEDGVWRVTGSSPSSISVSEFDRSLKLVHPNCVVEMDNAIYAWTNRGVLRIDETGWTSISEGKIEIGIEEQARLTVTGGTAKQPCGLYALPSVNYLVLAVSDTPTGLGKGQKPDTFYAYGTRTGQWSTWDFDEDNTNESINGFADSYDLGKMYAFGVRTDTNVPLVLEAIDRSTTKESNEFSQRSAYFLQSTTTDLVSNIESHSDGTFSVSADTTGWSAGQSVYNHVGGSLVAQAVVRSVSSNAHVARIVVADGDTLAMNPAVASTSRYKPFKCTWKSLPRSAQNMGMVKEWLDVSPVFSSLVGVHEVVIGVQSDTNDTSSVVTASFNSLDATAQVRSIRTSVNRDHAYGNEISPTIAINSGAGQWRLKGVSYTYRPVGPRIDSRE